MKIISLKFPQNKIPASQFKFYPVGVLPEIAFVLTPTWLETRPNSCCRIPQVWLSR